MTRNWILGTAALVLTAGGAMLRNPGPEGRYLAGSVLMIAGITVYLRMIRSES